MILEQQVCSLELAKQLKELGVKQESLFYWITWKDGETTLHNYSGENQELAIDYYSAFTASELGEILPGTIKKENGENMWWQTHKTTDGRIVIGWKDTESINDWEKLFMFEKTEANARAKMLVYLITNKLIKL